MSIAGVKCGDDKTEVKKFSASLTVLTQTHGNTRKGAFWRLSFDDDGKVTMLSISDIDDEDT